MPPELQPSTTHETPLASAAAGHTMACMEVWGGNRTVDTGVDMPGLEAWVYSRPYQAITNTDGGGDLHYLTSCATGRVIRMLLADVSGHGAPVARVAESLRRLVRKHSNYISQDALMQAVNREFAAIAAEASDVSAMFATAVVATYFTPTDEITLSIAGHPRPMLRNHSRSWSRIDADPSELSSVGGPANLPLGILEDSVFVPVTIRLGEQDMLLLYSDSLIEAAGADGRQLGEAGLAAVLNNCRASSPQALVPELLANIASLTGRASDHAFDDDVTILVLRRNQRKPSPSPWLGFVSAWRITRDAVLSLRPGALPASFPEFSLRSIFGSSIQQLNRSRPKS